MHSDMHTVTAAGWLASPGVMPELRFATVPAHPAEPGRRLHWIALGLTLLVQAGLWALMSSSAYRHRPAGGQPLDVVFIEPVIPQRWPLPPMPVAPSRTSVTRASAPATSPVSAEREPAAVPDMRAASMPATRAPRLFDADARPLLPSEAPGIDNRYVAPQSRAQNLRALGSRPKLPGRSETIVDIGELPQSASPAELVGMIGQYLFGASQPDSCDKVETRLLNETDPLARQINLDTFDKRCRGWR